MEEQTTNENRFHHCIEGKRGIPINKTTTIGTTHPRDTFLLADHPSVRSSAFACCRGALADF